tara:strand:- start:114 stop:509 length:396 start_codon:yes stop_codon:yes gene_type:complete
MTTNANIKFLDHVIKEVKEDDFIPNHFSLKYIKNMIIQVEKENKITRKPTEYNLFVKEQMPIMKHNHPDGDYRDFMKEIGKMWTDKKKEKESIYVDDTSSTEEENVKKIDKNVKKVDKKDIIRVNKEVKKK